MTDQDLLTERDEAIEQADRWRRHSSRMRYRVIELLRREFALAQRLEAHHTRLYNVETTCPTCGEPLGRE